LKFASRLCLAVGVCCTQTSLNFRVPLPTTPGIPHCKELTASSSQEDGTPSSPAANSTRSLEGTTTTTSGAAAPPRRPFSSLFPSPLLIIGRVYVNPRTGVGPAGAQLLTFHSLVLTPAAVALPGDSRPRYDSRIFSGGGGGGTVTDGGSSSGGGGGESSQGQPRAAAAQGEWAPPPGACMRSMTGAAQCASGSWSTCCESVGSWNSNGCYCSQEGAVLMGSMPAVMGPAMWTGLSLSCRLGQPERACLVDGGGGRAG
jgi:hypothetical protein